MKGDAKVIEFLNRALTNELTAINQYWLHYRVLKNWGVSKLAEFERHESIDEMKHADTLADRILFLDGLPNFQAIGKANMLGEGGLVKIVADKDGGPVLGVHMVGPHVTDLISEAMLAVAWEAVPAEVAVLMHPHPSLSEGVGEAFLGLAGKPLHGGSGGSRSERERASGSPPDSGA